jgi:hypothetical protein
MAQGIGVRQDYAHYKSAKLPEHAEACNKEQEVLGLQALYFTLFLLTYN